MKLFEGLFSKLFEKKNIYSEKIFSVFNNKVSIQELIDKVVTAKGEASALIYSEKLMIEIENFNDNALSEFFFLLCKDFDINSKELISLIRTYSDNKSIQNYKSMTTKFHSRRVEIFTKLNAIERGTIRLVKMREKLLNLLENNSELNKVDIDLTNLFRSWFNRGFLVIHPITWNTSARILDKIVKYEAVHEISSWMDLRNRLEPEDRKCYSFFHPTMRDEPLIFVEIALTADVPSKIDEILDINRRKLNEPDFKTAVFYSISNCQKGLKGISFGNFLLKQVIVDLKKEFPSLESFVTLSPVPGFNDWLKKNNKKLFDKIIDEKGVFDLKDEILNHSLKYLFNAKQKDRLPLDVVQRFHLSNGAILDNIHTMADLSKKGISRSAGLMVNYKYEINMLENNHEKYFARDLICASKPLLLKYKKIK